MSQINIDLGVVEDLNNSLKQSLNKLSKMTGTLSSLANNVDSAITSKRDIGQTTESQVAKDILIIKNKEAKKSWFDNAVQGVKAGWNQLEESVEHVITEAEDNASRFLSNAANEAFEIIGGVLYYRGKSIDFIENAADTAIQHLQESAVGSLLEGAADAAVENLSLGLVHNEANTEHPKSYAAGRILGDFASEVISLVSVK